MWFGSTQKNPRIQRAWCLQRMLLLPHWRRIPQRGHSLSASRQFTRKGEAARFTNCCQHITKLLQCKYYNIWSHLFQSHNPNIITIINPTPFFIWNFMQRTHGVKALSCFYHLRNHGFDLITSFVLDAMHNFFLGVIKQLCMFYFSSEFKDYPYSLFNRLEEIDRVLMSLSKVVPHEFSRFRKLSGNLLHYKGNFYPSYSMIFNSNQLFSILFNTNQLVIPNRSYRIVYWKTTNHYYY